MNFTTQPKLSRSEWNSVEEPVSEDEQRILKLIIDGYNDINIRHNNNASLLSKMKIDKSDAFENLLYHKFFKAGVSEIQAIRGLPTTLSKYTVKEESTKKMKKADLIRLENTSSKMHENRDTIMEYAFIDFCKEMLKLFTQEKYRYSHYLYTLVQLRDITVSNLNRHLMDFVDLAIAFIIESPTVQGKIVRGVILNAHDFIEQNPNLYKYNDITLYDHQKRLFSTMKSAYAKRHVEYQVVSNLVLYIAPTGTGKTLSPIGLSEQYRVIFVCAARHVGMALAKAAISARKCVAFAFGCETASDIRLHNYSATSYKLDKYSGGIGKVDNSVGHKVEIMICDVKSYLTAMYYMMSFNQTSSILTYWDEPTIGMDDTSDANPLHQIIHENWSENKIFNMVLSSATLPTADELKPMIDDFRNKFENVTVTEIKSYDCNKSITLMNKMGYCVCPHLLHEDYRKMIECAEYCDSNRTLLRYFDLKEVVRFIDYITESGDVSEDYSADAYFDGSIRNIKMNSIKLYYIALLKQVDEKRWSFIYKAMKDSLTKRGSLQQQQIKKSTSVDSSSKASNSSNKYEISTNETIYKMGGAIARTTSVALPTKKVQEDPIAIMREKSEASGNILITTVDAHTLTDGPTIYLAEDVDKIGKFYMQQSNIPREIFDKLITTITHNNEVLRILGELTARREDILGEEIKKENKMTKMTCNEFYAPAVKKVDEEIEDMQRNLKPVSLDPNYIPNTTLHQEIWVSKNSNHFVKNAFVPSIDPDTVKEIMGLKITDGMKLLILLGIGVFTESSDNAYLEIIKRLAFEKRLFLIIASSDYIYGTNYQFCHGFIGKDLQNMTQQKTIQALGRIGRNNMQQDYTARFRDDDIIANLFCANASNVEAQNMCRLLQSDDN
jgi:hypothetical protein